MTRYLRWTLSIAALVSAACATAARPFVADAGAITVDQSQWLMRLDTAGGVRTTEGTGTFGAIASVESRNRHVRVLQIVPQRLRVREGDTLAPLVLLRVSGLDSSGTLISNVAPLFGPFRGDGVVRPLSNGTWLAARVGQAAVGVRVLRIAQTLSNDTALVRWVTVEVVP